jgi:hypothetical protein
MALTARTALPGLTLRGYLRVDNHGGAAKTRYLCAVFPADTSSLRPDPMRIDRRSPGSFSAPTARMPIRSPSPSPGRARLAALAIAGAVLALGLAAHAVEPQAPVADVIGFDLRDLDAQGLVGPAGGKRAVDYEFCIPQGAAFEQAVSAIDETARFQPGSRGRIGCGPGQVLVLGNTHRPDFASVLQRLADLPYVERIQRAWFE